MTSPTNELAKNTAHTLISFTVMVLVVVAIWNWLEIAEHSYG